MKRALTTGALLLSSFLAIPSVARADHSRARWSFGFGLGFEGAHFQAGFSRGFAPACAPVRHVHSRSPIYKQVWVPAAYNQVIVGYDHCRRPIYRTVMVRSGYYDNVVVGYRCGACRSYCD